MRAVSAFSFIVINSILSREPSRSRAFSRESHLDRDPHSSQIFDCCIKQEASSRRRLPLRIVLQSKTKERKVVLVGECSLAFRRRLLALSAPRYPASANLRWSYSDAFLEPSANRTATASGQDSNFLIVVSYSYLQWRRGP